MTTAAEVFRDYVVDGVASSGVYQPTKASIRNYLKPLDALVWDGSTLVVATATDITLPDPNYHYTTGALVVNGGASIRGNLQVEGGITSFGGLVLTFLGLGNNTTVGAVEISFNCVSGATGGGHAIDFDIVGVQKMSFGMWSAITHGAFDSTPVWRSNDGLWRFNGKANSGSSTDINLAFVIDATAGPAAGAGTQGAAVRVLCRTVTNSAGIDVISANATESLSIDAKGAGQISLQGTATGAVVVAGSAQLHILNAATTGSAANVFIDTGTSPVGQLKRSTSSIRYKRDVEDVGDGVLDLLLALRPVTYRSRCTGDDQRRQFFGLIAEEVEEVDPRLVQHGASGPESVMYDRVAVLALGVIQKQERRIAALEARLRKE